MEVDHDVAFGRKLLENHGSSLLKTLLPSWQQNVSWGYALKPAHEGPLYDIAGLRAFRLPSRPEASKSGKLVVHLGGEVVAAACLEHQKLRTACT